jgi:hypothetical protein
MPSPFPGMDPYLESPVYWAGFHTSLNVAIMAGLSSRLPVGYYADVDRHIWVDDELPEDDRFLIGRPDVYISQSDGGTAVATATKMATKPTGRALLKLAAKKRTQRFVKIVDQSDHRFVTVIEVLSPSNKVRGPDRDNYIAKRNEYLTSGIHFVELDLLRGGSRMPMGTPSPVDADYYVMIACAHESPNVSYWAFTVRDTMPVLPIPLKPEDGAIDFELRPCLDRAYEDAGYSRRIDYALTPEPDLRRHDAEWSRSFLPPPKTSSRARD